jgi:hypothetical protein
MFDLVIGLRVKDADAAKGLIPLVEQVLGSQLEAQPMLKERLQHETIGDVDVLTLKLDGSMVPWDDLPLDDVTGEPGKYDSLIAKFKTMTIAFGLCVKGDYLLLSVGDTNAHIETLGAGKGLLARPELAKLKIVEGKKLSGVQYASPQAMQMTANQAVAPLLSLLSIVPQMLPATTDDMLRARIDDDRPARINSESRGDAHGVNVFAAGLQHAGVELDDQPDVRRLAATHAAGPCRRRSARLFGSAGQAEPEEL